MVVNGKLKSRLKWSWPNRGIIAAFAWKNWEKHEKSCQVSRRPIETHTGDTEHNSGVLQLRQAAQWYALQCTAYGPRKYFSFFLCLLILFLCIIFLCLFSCFVCLLYILCTLCFCIFCLLFLLLYIGVSYLYTSLRPLPPGGNPIAVNKYHVISNLQPILPRKWRFTKPVAAHVSIRVTAPELAVVTLTQWLCLLEMNTPKAAGSESVTSHQTLATSQPSLGVLGCGTNDTHGQRSVSTATFGLNIKTSGGGTWQ
jgi:hypothetical protein